MEREDNVFFQNKLTMVYIQNDLTQLVSYWIIKKNKKKKKKKPEVTAIKYAYLLSGV